MQEVAPRLENLIRIESNNNVIFSPVNVGDVRIRRVFTNHRCHIFKAFPHEFRKGETAPSDYLDYWSLLAPEPGCMVIAEVDRIESLPPLYMHTCGLVKNSSYHSGYAAFTFEGGHWGRWNCFHDVRIYLDQDYYGLQVAIGDVRGELVRVSSRNNQHELISLEYALDYCVGKRSLSDILALLELEERRSNYPKRRRAYEEALTLALTLKGAVRSPTTAKIVEILKKLEKEDRPL